MFFNILFRTDVHVADKSPDSWKGDYSAEVWSNLEQIGVLARKYNCQAVLDGGDYFHVKASTRNSHALVARSAEIHATYPCPVYVVPGNHDIAYNNLETLDQQQPLRVLFSTQVFYRLGSNEYVLEESGLKVRLVGFPFDPCRTLDQFRSIRKGAEDYLIVVAHALASENVVDLTEDFFGESIFRYGDLTYADGPDVYCFGHWHRDQGVSKIGSCYFVNPGAVSRGALVRDNLKRTPQVALIQLTKEEIVVGTIPLDVLPAKDVFDLERKERRDRESEIIDQFAKRLQQEILELPSEDIVSYVDKLNFAPEVRSLAQIYLEKARS